MPSGAMEELMHCPREARHAVSYTPPALSCLALGDADPYRCSTLLVRNRWAASALQAVPQPGAALFMGPSCTLVLACTAVAVLSCFAVSCDVSEMSLLLSITRPLPWPARECVVGVGSIIIPIRITPSHAHRIPSSRIILGQKRATCGRRVAAAGLMEPRLPVAPG